MQTEQQVKQIIEQKVRETSNKKTLDDMKKAIDEIDENQRMNRSTAIFGLLLLLSTGSLTIIYLFF